MKNEIKAVQIQTNSAQCWVDSLYRNMFLTLQVMRYADNLAFQVRQAKSELWIPPTGKLPKGYVTPALAIGRTWRDDSVCYFIDKFSGHVSVPIEVSYGTLETPCA